VKRTALALGLLRLLAMLAVPESAPATPGTRVLLYGGAGQGRVVFDARLHRAKGFVCNDCHNDLFATRKTALIDQAAHRSGKACFACHDGKRAFETCDGCHRSRRS
jgi:phosphate transport system substrate-binding protein